MIMMKKLLFIFTSVLIISGCTDDRMKVTIENTLRSDRMAETVEISITDLMALLPDSNP